MWTHDRETVSRNLTDDDNSRNRVDNDLWLTAICVPAPTEMFVGPALKTRRKSRVMQQRIMHIYS